jgi:hypothetical protein
VGEVRFQFWLPLIERVEIEDMVMIGHAEGDGKPPVYAIMVLKEKNRVSAVEAL